jgi:hypothetical protein
MHISNVREEKRPTPASTPTGKSLGWVPTLFLLFRPLDHTGNYMSTALTLVGFSAFCPRTVSACSGWPL